MIDDVQDQSQVNIDQYAKMLWRRRWWLLLPAFSCWLAAWGVSWILPTAYESKATILVVQPNVPEQYVVPNVTMSLQEQLASIEQQILSRPRLQSIIDRYHLYQQSSRWSAPVDPVEQMRKDIDVNPLLTPNQSGRPGDLTAFQIVFMAPSARLAQQIDGELASLFIDENLRTQQQLSQSTTTFLQQQLADARKKLEEQEQKVSAFKAKYLGQLPSQLQSNVQILTGMESQLQNLEQELDRAQQQKLYLQSLLDQYRSTVALADTGSPATTPAVLDNQIKQLELQLADARSHYTDNYPDVVALKEQIEKTKKLRDQMVADTSAPSKPGSKQKDNASAADTTDPQLAQPIMQTQSQLKANQLQIQDYKGQIQDLQGRIKDYEARLNLTPVREQEFEEISRGYDESEANYSALLKRLNESQLATDLQQEQQGQHFQLIDPADAPLAPFSPNRLLISLGGLAAGVFLGIGLTLLKELTDVRVRQEKDLEDIVSARVLVGIPLMSSSVELKHRKWMRLAESAVMLLLTLSIVAGNVISFIKG